MTKLYIHPGYTVDTVVTDNVKSGDLYMWGNEGGVASRDAAKGERCQINLHGVHYVLCDAAINFADGAAVYATADTGVAEATDAATTRFIGIATTPEATEVGAGLVYAPAPLCSIAGKKYVAVNFKGVRTAV